MQSNEACNVLDEGIDRAEQIPVLLESGVPIAASLAINQFPVSLMNLVGEYFSDDKYDPVKTALLGEQPITLSLSNDVDSELGFSWCMGFLPPECKWQERAEIKVDKQIPIGDREDFLHLLSRENSNYCRVVIQSLLVNLSLAPSDFQSALNDLLSTIKALRGHLSSVKRVSISVTEYASCWFSLQDPLDQVTGLPQLFDHEQALHQIIDDWQACWQKNQTLDVCDLLRIYSNSNAKPTSDMYLAKFVILLDDPLGLALCKKVAPDLVSDKIMWVYYCETFEDLKTIERDMIYICHVIHLDASNLHYNHAYQLGDRLTAAFDYRNNRFIERIFIRSNEHGRPILLPQPSAPLTCISPFSALVELTLEGDNRLHLTDLNSGYFPNLVELSVIGGEITGHLNSDSVPRLKRLTLSPENFGDRSTPAINSSIQDHCQSIIQADRPWQLVAANDRYGWSLASYDRPISNPQREEKESLSPVHWQPIIRDLLLVMRTNKDAKQWQTRLEGHSSFETTANNHKEGLLVWTPECVEKITAFGLRKNIQMDFANAVQGKARILTSWTSCCIDVLIDGAKLPHLQSLDVKVSAVMLSGAFPNLQSLSFQHATLKSQWKMDAPSLKFLHCDMFSCGKDLTLHLESLPNLSFLQITSRTDYPSYCPEIIMDDDNVGFSRIKHVVFGMGMIDFRYFNQLQVHHVSQLELIVDLMQLPEGWSREVWQCEVLKIHVYDLLFDVSTSPELSVATLLPAMPRVKTLTVTEKNCFVVLDSELPDLTECTVTSPRVLGPNLRCPKLRCIRFTETLSEKDKKWCLDPVNYLKMDARPKLIYFDFDGEVHKMAWDDAPNNSLATSVMRPLEDDFSSFQSLE